MKTKLWLFLTAFALVFSACEKDAEFSGNLNNDGGRDIESLDNCVFYVDNQGIATTHLIAGQDQYVGEVEVKLGDEDITVTYKTSEGWYLTETHLHIAKDEEALFAQVTNRAGNPRIGNFDYGVEGIFQKSWSITIEKSEIDPESTDGCYVFAAHAVVAGLDYEGDGYVNLDAFAVNLPETATVQVTWPDPENNPEAATYFPNVEVTNAGIINGDDHTGWCIDTDYSIYEREYSAEVFSSYEEVPGYDPDFLMRLNWIINEEIVGIDAGGDLGAYTYGDVQVAIWTLKLGYTEFNDEVEGKLGRNQDTGAYPLNPTYIGSWEEDRINQILDQVEDGFVPECGDYIAIVFITPESVQDFIIKIPFPCYQDETAWGQGCLFTERGSWAMYFGVCPQ